MTTSKSTRQSFSRLFRNVSQAGCIAGLDFTPGRLPPALPWLEFWTCEGGSKNENCSLVYPRAGGLACLEVETGAELRTSAACDVGAGGSRKMSGCGTKQTSILTLNMSAFGGKADIADPLSNG